MRYALSVILLLLSISLVHAQKYNGYVDVSVPGISPFALSATYNYKLKKHFGLGGGIQVFNYHPVTNRPGLIPAAFADLRFYHRPGKTHQFFSMIDIGASIYKAGSGYNKYMSAYYSYRGGSFYLGLGFGYLYSITRRGGGPYAAFRILSNTSIREGYQYPGRRPVDAAVLEAVPSICIGFKF
jgi:hypothetical protein